MTSKNLLKLVALSAALTISPMCPAASLSGKDGARISKCQDDAGKWHYGDNAAAECAKSKIEVLSKQGTKKKEIAAPPTEAELADRERRKDEIEREKLSAEEKEKRDKILLQTYAVEDDIILVRDRKLSQIETNIKGSEETLKSLRKTLERMEVEKASEEEKNDKKSAEQTGKNIDATKAQIQRHEMAVSQKRQEQEKLRKQYGEDLERYRELRKQQTAKMPPKKQAAQ